MTEAITPTGNRIQVRLLKGEYKNQPNNPKRADGTVHEYCPYELTGDEMQNLVRLYREAEGKFDPVVLAVWLHHRFTQIHPFQDGNGRVARALASLVFLKAQLFPLVIREAESRRLHSSARDCRLGRSLAAVLALCTAPKRLDTESTRTRTASAAKPLCRPDYCLCDKGS